MIILHIASIDNDRSSGVSVIVPEHVRNQNRLVNVALLNCSGILIDTNNTVIDYPVFTTQQVKSGDISKLPKPFNKPDLVVFHGIYFPYFCKVTKYLLQLKIPYVIVPHGSLTSFAQQKKYLKKMLGNLIFFNKFIKNSVAIQYLTIEEQQNSSVWENKSYVCGNGMYLHNNVKLNSLGKKKKFNLTFIGRMDPFHKGIDVLIEACNSISEDMRKNKIELSIFGTNYQNGKDVIYDLIKRYKLEDIVKLGGPLYGDDKIEQLTNTDVFVLTSRFEGQPLGAMEALAMGIPAILTPGTNMADDVVKYECGWKADFSVSDIAEKIIDAYNSKNKLYTFSQNAINMAKNNYSWECIAQKSIEEYKKILLEKAKIKKGYI